MDLCLIGTCLLIVNSRASFPHPAPPEAYPTLYPNRLLFSYVSDVGLTHCPRNSGRMVGSIEVDERGKMTASYGVVNTDLLIVIVSDRIHQYCRSLKEYLNIQDSGKRRKSI